MAMQRDCALMNKMNNIILTQEIIHLMTTSKSKKGTMAIKIDLEKAFNRLEWGFIRQTLIYFKFPPDWISLIMSCISSSNLLILLNGDRLDPFHPSRGIRQGDHFSPNIFILCMEYLAWLIQEEVSSGNWKGIRASRNGPTFTHLFFADDLILFATASLKNYHTIKKVLDTFCLASSQKINHSKSKIFFSPCTSPRNIEMVENELGFSSTRDFGNYLGAPILTDKRNKRVYNFIIDKLRARLASWKANTLSFASRLTLINSVTIALPTHIMQCTLLPTKVCKEIDKLNRNFLWGDTTSNKKMHLKKWSIVTLPKAVGGLSIKRSLPCNKALLDKRAWTLQSNTSDPWAITLKSKYPSHLPPTKRLSSTWHSLTNVNHICDKGTG